MKRGEIDRTAIGPTTSIRLAVAAELAFPGAGISVAALRKERDLQNLVTWKVGNREFTTLAHIDQMIERKQRQAEARISTRVQAAAGDRAMDADRVSTELRELLAETLAAEKPKKARKP
ncbi:hypothetical protein [Beijerinckia sp. L45]|uniref:hypothetical protein n=1 Tax=Beijerinckia sp. L45 TaxID=1641855 RepID=UPI00131A734C|nr:hypothetical protein [Beijerinckia sp. L45]